MTIPMSDAARRAALAILDAARDMTVATNRGDGFPQATVVSFVSDGLKIYFGCSLKSQKAHNLARDDRVSATVTPPYRDWSEIRGLSIGGRARLVSDEMEKMRVSELMLRRFPQVVDYVKQGDSADLGMFRIDAEVISLLDYARGFGHAELMHLALPAARAM
jgi:nitroimidazol reductase NimA-like FMN-containing flavoprotein (pyridoxamine 5'-phosphate oxidase superfamily)